MRGQACVGCAGLVGRAAGLVTRSVARLAATERVKQRWMRSAYPPCRTSRMHSHAEPPPCQAPCLTRGAWQRVDNNVIPVSPRRHSRAGGNPDNLAYDQTTLCLYTHQQEKRHSLDMDSCPRVKLCAGMTFPSLPCSAIEINIGISTVG